MNDELRKLPGVDRVIAETGLEPGPLLTQAARKAVEAARAEILEGRPCPHIDDIVKAARADLESQKRRMLGKVINATGVVLHTNLGRAPLSQSAREAVMRLDGYSNLEFDVDEGTRGSRYSHAAQLLTLLTGAEDAIVVNNNAAAVTLCLRAFAFEQEVIISRGELIEIGGEFRIPEVLKESGAHLREVGTTNRTRLKDYKRAINSNTAVLLKVHPSNYRVIGFTESATTDELSRLARSRKLILIYDIGSGLLRPSSERWLAGEPSVVEAVDAGADVVTFSADKLLGGPQAGIILARQPLIAKLRTHPMLRAVRVGKMTLAALEATLLAYLEGSEDSLPVWQLSKTPPSDIEARAVDLVARLDAHAGSLTILKGESLAGGGSAPGATITTFLIALSHPRKAAGELARTLLACTPPVVARVEDARLLIDLRTVMLADQAYLEQALTQVLTDD